ncbi:MAG: lactoylglutathione lyase [Alphaproteobacteria bacterium]|nr:lactoylglutathione lyase [Alphaproteobacteria bacterium]
MNEKTRPNAHGPAPPARMLHTMIRVSNLEQSLAFYLDALGMHELRREDYPEGRFTLVFVGYGDEASNTVIEMTHNWDEGDYSHGTGFGHIAIGVSDIYAACERLGSMGINIARDPGPMTFAADQTGARDVIAFVEDPDVYKIELIGSA